MNSLRLNEIQLDALKEVANIGSGHAATSLSELINRKILICVPQFLTGNFSDITAKMGDSNKTVASVILNFIGDLSGRFLVIYPINDVQILTTIFIDTKTKPPPDFRSSLLKEVSNILFCSYMNALGEMLGFLILPSVPDIHVDITGIALTRVLQDLGYDEQMLFCIETEFILEEREKPLHAFLLLMPDVNCLHLILKELDLLKK